MEKFISFGKNNKLYKYLWIYVIIRLVYDYLFSDVFPNQIKPSIFDSQNYPPNILIQTFFNYLGALIFSIVFYLYLKSQVKIVKKDELLSSSNAFKKYKLIFEEKGPKIQLRPLIFTIFLSITSIELIKIIVFIDLWSLSYWVFDLFFISYINLMMFGIPIFSHKKCAIIFILIFSTLFKLLSTFEYINNDNYNLFYKNHIILIPIIAITFPCLSLLRFYSLCKITWLLDYKFIPVKIFFLIYNIIGVILLLISSLISSNVKCMDKAKINDINLICSIKIGNDYYFDSFSYYFKQLWRNERNIGLNILYLFLFLIQLLLNALRILYSILIVKHLNPEFYLCSYEIYFFSIRFIGLIKAIIDDNNIVTEIYNLLAELFSLIGVMVYLELIEFKFCNLNHNLKKNIEMRSINEYSIQEINDDDISNIN